MSLLPGACVVCTAATWRSVIHPRTEQTLLLWPIPSSRYAVFHVEPDGVASGIGYCAACAPELCAGPPEALRAVLPTATHVRRVEPAATRYAAWFEPPRRAFLAAWLKDEVGIDPATWLHQWDVDREEALNVAP